MSIFNPSIPDTKEANWLGWSKPISTMQGDTSTGEILSGAGDLVSRSLQVADFGYKSRIDDLVHQGVDKLRDEYTDSLNKTDISMKLAQAAGTGSATDAPVGGIKSVYDAPPRDIMSPEAQNNLPSDIRGLPGRLVALDGGKANGNLSETAYYGRLDALSKDLRSRYPGYRDYIDKEFERVSGVNAANKYLAGMVSDINSFISGNKSEHDYWRKQIVENSGYPGAAQMLQRWENGKASNDDIMKWLGPIKQFENDMKMRALARTDAEGGRKLSMEQVEDDYLALGNGIAGAHFNSLAIIGNANTPEQIFKIVQEANLGQRTLTQTDAFKLADMIMAYKNQAELAMRAKATEVPKEGGKAMADIIRPERLTSVTNSILDKYDLVYKALKSEQYGAAFSTMRSMQAQLTDAKYQMVTDKEMGESFVMSQVIQGMGLDAYSKKFWEGQLTSNTAGTKYEQWLKNVKLHAATDEIRFQTPTKVLKERMDEAVTKGIKLPTTYNELIEQVEGIADKDTPLAIRKGLIKYAYDTKNLGLISRIERDGIDPTTGKKTDGQYSVYKRMTSAELTKSIWEASGGDPNHELWTMYRNWGKQTFARELYGPALKDLKAIQENPDIKIGWDSDNHRFIPPPLAPAGEGLYRFSHMNMVYVRGVIENINKGIGGVANIAKQDGSNVNAYVLGVLKDEGVNIKMPGIPGDMMRAIIKSQEEKQEKKKKLQQDYKLNFAPEELPSSGSLGGSLGDYLANPGRVVAPIRQNAPAGSARRPIGNLSDNPIHNIKIDDIPEGMSARDFIKRLKERP